MWIKSIAFVGFKGLTGVVNLDKLNLFIGPNGTGKTAHLLGPQFAIEGTTPGGKRPEDGMHFAGPTGCSVALECDDGFTFSRGISHNHAKHTTATALSVGGRGDLNARAAEPIVHGHLGNFAPMWDLGAFLGLSPDKQRDYVLDLCSRAESGETADTAKLADRIAFAYLWTELGAGMVKTFLDNVDPETPARESVERLIDRLSTSDAEALRNQLLGVKQVLSGDTIGCIASALEYAKSTANGTKRARDGKQAAVRSLSERKAHLSIPAAGIDRLRAKRAELTKQSEDIKGQLERQRGKVTARETFEEDLRRFRELRAEAEAEREQALALYKDVVDKQRTADAEVAQGGADLPELATCKVNLAAARDLAYKAKAELLNARNALVSSETVAAAELRRLSEAKASPWQRAKAIADQLLRVQLSGPEAVMVSGTKFVELFNELEALINKQCESVDVAQIEQHRDQCEQELKAARGRAEQTEQQAQEAHTSVAQLEESLAAAEKVEQLRGVATKIRNEVVRHENTLTTLRDQIEALDVSVLDRERKLNKLDSEGGHIPTEDLDRQHSAVGVALAELDDQIDRKTRFASLDTELTACIAEAERQTVAHEVAKQLGNAVRDLREELMAELIAPLVDKINAFLTLAAPGQTAYCDLANAKGTAIFELGWQGADRRVALVAMSAGEQAMFCIGLACALIALADPPLKLLLVEAGNLDAKNLLRAMDGIEQVTEDLHLSNVLLATHIDATVTDKTWNVVQL